MKIIFLGAPGSGKGTQAKKLSLHYKIITLSTGDLLRKEISNNSEIGCKSKDYINNGLLVPDDIINDIEDWKFEERLSKEFESLGLINSYHP